MTDKRDKRIKAPGHLNSETKKWFIQVADTYDLEPHHLRLLTLACEAWDRCTQARKELLKQKTLTVVDRYGQIKARPEVQIERDSRIAFARLLRELNLSEESPDSRPPALKYGGK